MFVATFDCRRLYRVVGRFMISACFWNRVACFFAFLLISHPAFSGSEDGVSKKITYEILSDYREKGKCDYTVEDINPHKRELSLLFLEDVLRGVIGQSSYTKDIVGNINVFKVGRNVSPVLIDLYEYAGRGDVRAEIDFDVKEMHGINSDFMSRNASLIQGKIPFCEMHKMLSGESFYFEEELDSYFRSLNQRVMNRNLNKLNDLAEDAAR